MIDFVGFTIWAAYISDFVIGWRRDRKVTAVRNDLRPDLEFDLDLMQET